jgi:hypothetical protein
MKNPAFTEQDSDLTKAANTPLPDTESESESLGEESDEETVLMTQGPNPAITEQVSDLQIAEQVSDLQIAANTPLPNTESESESLGEVV